MANMNGQQPFHRFDRCYRSRARCRSMQLVQRWLIIIIE